MIKYTSLCSFLLLLSGIFFTIPAQAASEVQVEVDGLRVRAEPGTEHPIIDHVNRNEQYPVLDKKEDWIQIRLSNGEQGWIAGWLVRSVGNDNDSSTFITSHADDLNVRSGPGKTFDVITRIHRSDTYPLVQEEGDWMQIQLSSSQKGWVAEWYVEPSSSAPSSSDRVKKTVTVQVPVLNVRENPGENHPRIGQLEQADEVQVQDVQDGWYQISYEDGTGWIAGEFTSGAEEDEPNADGEDSENQGVVDADELHVRQDPSLESDIVAQVKKGTSLTLLERRDEWIQVETEAGETGWAAEWLVSTSSADTSEEKEQASNNEPYIEILNPGTNLRQGPGLDHQVLSRGNVGQEFPVLGTEGKWYHIRLSDDRKAYVAGWIVEAHGVKKIERSQSESRLQDKVIVIDPGHGGKDSGAIGSFFQTLEKSVNMDVSERLASKLKAAGARVILTRSHDRYYSLQYRVNQAVLHRADAFISIHHNTHPNHWINGVITYYYTDGNDRTLARHIQQEVLKQTGSNNMDARKGNYFVLRENPRLAVLCELGFLSNNREESVIRTSSYKEKAAEGVFRGILRYFQNR